MVALVVWRVHFARYLLEAQTLNALAIVLGHCFVQLVDRLVASLVRLEVVSHYLLGQVLQPLLAFVAPLPFRLEGLEPAG